MFGLFDEETGRLENQAAQVAGMIAVFIKIFIFLLRHPWLIPVILVLPWVLTSQDVFGLIFGIVLILGGIRLRVAGY